MASKSHRGRWQRNERGGGAQVCIMDNIVFGVGVIKGLDAYPMNYCK